MASELKMLRWAHMPEALSLPPGWTLEAFSSVAKVIAGQSPSSEACSEKEEGLPFLQGNADFSEKYPVPAIWCTSPVKRAKLGDTLISVRAPVGEINRADREYAIGRGLAAVRAYGNSDFIYHAMQHWRWSLQRVAQGTTFDAVTARHFSQLRVAFPPPAEQAAIAQILDAADTAIERTHEAVAKARELRRALMQDLLTKGIGENGAIRDPLKYKEAFYTTELGLLPQTWQVKSLKDIAEVERGKFTPRPRNDPRYYGGEFPFVQTGQVVKAQGRLMFYYEQTLNELGKSVSREFPTGTILVTIAANIGDTAILGIPMCVPDSIVGVQVTAPNNPRFIELCLRRLKPRLLALAPRSAQHNINLTALRPLRIPIPPPSEQQKIAEIYETAETLITVQEEKVARLTTLKKSLMHDLLSGSKRVNTVGIAEQLELF